MKPYIVLAVCVIFLMAGCAHNQVKTSASAPAEVNKAPEVVKAAPAAPVVPQAEGNVQNEAGLAASQKEIQDIHFDYDKADLNGNARSELASLSSILEQSRGSKVVIEGNCDERGTAEYNLALGDRRARAARQYLVSLGVLPNRIETVSYGKEKPLCTEKTEECWFKNRRDHFVLAPQS